MDHGVKVASVLANSFSRRCSYIAESDAHVKEKAIQFGFVLGTFNNPSPLLPMSDLKRMEMMIKVIPCVKQINLKSHVQVVSCLTPAGMETQRRCSCRACSCARSTVRSCTVSGLWNAASGQPEPSLSNLHRVISSLGFF